MFGLLSSYSITECNKRIKKTPHSRSDLIIDGKKPLITTLNDTELELRAQRNYSHSFVPYLHCKIESYDVGTKIECTPKVGRSALFIKYSWYIIAVPLSVLVIVSCIQDLMGYSSTNSKGNPTLGIISTLIFLLGGFGLDYSGRYLGKKEIPELKKYLLDRLDAKEVNI